MLQAIRERAQGWFAALIFGVLVIAFGFWGINFYADGESEKVVAEINGHELKQSEFERGFYNYKQQLQATLGAAAKLSEMDQSALRQQAMQQLLDNQLLLQAAVKSKLRVSDGHLAVAIQSLEPFQRDGKFANDLYRNQLQALGMSETGFETQMREDLVAAQLRDGIQDTDFVTPTEESALLRAKTEQRDLMYLTVSAETYHAAIQPTDAEIEAHYQENTAPYLNPESVKIAYLELSADVLAQAVSVDEAKLKEYYESNIAEFTTPEERSANHILVQVPKDAKPDEEEAARKMAEGYLNEAKTGKSFEDIAIAHSDDVGSKGEGGKTGFFRRGVMAPAFEDAAFSMSVNELRGPIRTEFGFHILRLNEIKAEVKRSFEEAKTDVETAYRQKQAEQQYYDLAAQLSDLTYENADSLQPAAEALKLTVQESQPLTRSGMDAKDPLADAKILDAAFSEEVLKEGLNSKVIELSLTHSLVLRALEYKPAAPKPLTEVRERVRSALVSKLAAQKAAAEGAQMLADLRAGGSQQAVAAAKNITWKEAKAVTRADQTLPRALLREAFTLNLGSDGKTQYGQYQTGTGDYTIIGLTTINHGDASKVKAEDRKTTLQQANSTLGAHGWRDFMAGLKQRAKQKIYQENL